MEIRIRKYYPALIACVIAIVAAVYFLWATNQGIGIHGDSTAYLGTAENLLKGNGFVFGAKAMTAYGPFYPMVLAFSGLFIPDLFIAARWLHVILYVSNALLFSGIFYVITNRNLLAAGLASAIFITSKTVIYIHTLTWSEPLFILLTFLACFILARYFVTQKWKYLLYGSILCSLAIVTRYVGLALIPAVGLGILLLSAQPFKKRLIALIAFCSIALLPMTGWAIRNWFITQNGQQAGRALLFHPRSIATLGREFASLFYTFIFPGEGSKYWMTAVIGLLILCQVVLLGILWKNRAVYLGKYRYETSIFLLTVLISVSFIVMVIGSITFVDASIPISERIFIPVLLLMTIFTFSALFLLARLNKRKEFIWVPIALMVVFMHFNIPEARIFAQNIHENGISYNGVQWRNSATLNAIRELDSEPVLYSNGSDVIILLTGRIAETFPQRRSNRLGLENDNYQQDLLNMCEDVRNGGAIIVYLKHISRPHLTGYDELVNICQLPNQVEFDDGAFFGGITP